MRKLLFIAFWVFFSSQIFGQVINFWHTYEVPDHASIVKNIELDLEVHEWSYYRTDYPYNSVQLLYSTPDTLEVKKPMQAGFIKGGYPNVYYDFILYKDFDGKEFLVNEREKFKDLLCPLNNMSEVVLLYYTLDSPVFSIFQYNKKKHQLYIKYRQSRKYYLIEGFEFESEGEGISEIRKSKESTSPTLKVKLNKETGTFEVLRD